MSWNGLSRLSQDYCAQTLEEKQSQEPGVYMISQPGWRWCETQKQYSQYMSEPVHWYKQYRNACNVNQDSELRYSKLTNKGQVQQLMTRPYNTVPYMGSGQRSLNNKDIESRLIMGTPTTTYKSCEPTAGVSIDRFTPLPEYGNPQRIQHVLDPWSRSSTSNTRDYVRRVNYQRRIENMKNNQRVNKN